MNADEVIENAEAQISRETDERVRAIKDANAAAQRRLVENLGRCLECDEVHVERERVAAGCVTCVDCAHEIERLRVLRNRQYAH